jgi:hypothetical protein
MQLRLPAAGRLRLSATHPVCGFNATAIPQNYNCTTVTANATANENRSTELNSVTSLQCVVAKFPVHALPFLVCKISLVVVKDDNQTLYRECRYSRGRISLDITPYLCFQQRSVCSLPLIRLALQLLLQCCDPVMGRIGFLLQRMHVPFNTPQPLPRGAEVHL